MKKLIVMLLCLVMFTGCFHDPDPIILTGDQVVYILEDGKFNFYKGVGADRRLIESLEPTDPRIQKRYLISKAYLAKLIEAAIDDDNPDPEENPN